MCLVLTHFLHACPLWLPLEAQGLEQALFAVVCHVDDALLALLVRNDGARDVQQPPHLQGVLALSGGAHKGLKPAAARRPSGQGRLSTAAATQWQGRLDKLGYTTAIHSKDIDNYCPTVLAYLHTFISRVHVLNTNTNNNNDHTGSRDLDTSDPGQIPTQAYLWNSTYCGPTFLLPIIVQAIII